MDGDWEDGLNLDLKRMNISEAAMSSSKRLTATNPFEIDLIVEKVMDYLTYDALRTCFSVSWGWRKKAFLEMKSRESIRTIGLTAKNLKKLYVEIRRKKKAGKAVKLTKLNLDRLPLSTPLLHETLKLLSPYLDALIIRTDGKLHELFTTLQDLPNLSELSILPEPGSFLTEVEACQLTYPIQDPITSRYINFENIRSLSFYSSKTVPTSGGPTVKFYLKLSDALKLFPNLGTLHVGNLSVEDDRNFNGISFAKLKNLRLAHKFELDIKAINKSLGMLAKLGLKLARLQFQFTPLKGLDRDLFRKFVESQRDTLQHLDIAQATSKFITDDTADHTPNICPFPLNLPHLKTLHVQRPFIQKLTPIFNALPSLEEAKICVPKGFNWKDITTKVKKSYPNLQVLRVDYMHPSLFGIMSQYFPSLRVLQINMWDNVDQRVFSSMKTPAEDDSEPLSNMYPCRICGVVNTSKSNATCGSCGQKSLSLGYPDYSLIDGDQISRKAFDHWKEIDTLIAGNSGICFLRDKLKDHNKPYLPYLDGDVEIETLGIHGMAQWAMWEANEFNHQSHYLRPGNWTFTTCLTVDGLYIPFDNHPDLKSDDPLLLFRNIFF